MVKEVKEDYELIAKHCPACQSLVLARVEKSGGKTTYAGYKCSSCDWMSPANGSPRS